MIAFLEKYSRFFLILLSAIIVSIIVIVIVTEVQNRNTDRALVQLSELESEIQNDNPDFSIEMFQMRAAEVADISNNSYVQNRIRFLTGQVYWNQEQYEEAAEQFLQLTQKIPKSHLGQVAFFNAAASYEQIGDIDRAIEILERAVMQYEFATNPLLPRILLNLGRLHEAQGDVAQASEYYNTLINNYSGNELLNLAYNRLILIEP